MLDLAVDGQVIAAAHPEYERERLLWNARFDRRPLAVVKAASADDVSRVISYARERDLQLVARSGGHSFGGYCVAEGAVVVDVSDLSRVEVSRDGTQARVGAGATLLPIYQALWPHRRAIPGGTCPTVGIAGLTAAGGLGVLGRTHGLTCDSLLEAEVVTAAGELVRAAPDENDDLFWALRGGGGGNFGIVISLTFRLVPVDVPFTHATVEFGWDDAAGVVAAWQQCAHDAPSELWAALMAETRTLALGPSVLIEAVYAGDPARLDALIDDFPVRPSAVEKSTSDFVTIPSEFYCKGLRPEECRTADLIPHGKLPHTAYYAKCDVAKAPWPDEGIAELLAAIEERQRDPLLTPSDFDPHTDAGKLLLEIADGAVGSVAADATAFAHRDSLFVAQYACRWRKGSPGEVEAANLEWARRLWAAVEPYRSGCSYVGYIDPELESWEEAYYGLNLPRLRQIKTTYDPENVFSFERSIR